MKKPLKRFIVRKYVYAESASQALKRESTVRADDCWVDDEWVKQHLRDLNPAIGFDADKNEF